MSHHSQHTEFNRSSGDSHTDDIYPTVRQISFGFGSVPVFDAHVHLHLLMRKSGALPEQ